MHSCTSATGRVGQVLPQRALLVHRAMPEAEGRLIESYTAWRWLQTYEICITREEQRVFSMCAEWTHRKHVLLVIRWDAWPFTDSSTHVQ